MENQNEKYIVIMAYDYNGTHGIFIPSQYDSEEKAKSAYAAMKDCELGKQGGQALPEDAVMDEETFDPAMTQGMMALFRIRGADTRYVSMVALVKVA